MGNKNNNNNNDDDYDNDDDDDDDDVCMVGRWVTERDAFENASRIT